jgi:CxxC motif-containing protein (DUF1111 family)
MKTHRINPVTSNQRMLAAVLTLGISAWFSLPGHALKPAQSAASAPVRRAPSHHVPAPVPLFVAPAWGNAVNGLTSAQMAAFLDGQDQFNFVDTPETGLGPIFNDNSCVACHIAGAPGGAGNKSVTRYGKTENGLFDPLTSLGGSLLHKKAIAPQLRETIPLQANTVAQRVTTPLFGLGLVEAIPDATILANARRVKPDGIRGRAAVVTDVATGQSRVGRFGWKAQHATLLSFTADAYQNEVGVTNRFFPHENAPNGNTALLGQWVPLNAPYEDQPDPDTHLADIDRLVNFITMLAPPPPRPLSPSATAGQRVFAQIGCIECHQPTMMTGSSSIVALDRKVVPLYSDLLLHDMGSLNDRIAQADAGTNEMRTAPLWGVRVRKALLHDGRADSMDAAIGGHDGEGARARDRYWKLDPASRTALVDFLNTL